MPDLPSLRPSILSAAAQIRSALLPLSELEREAACRVATFHLAAPVPPQPPAWAMRRIMRVVAANPTGMAPKHVAATAGLVLNSSAWKQAVEALIASGEIRAEGYASSRTYYPKEPSNAVL